MEEQQQLKEGTLLQGGKYRIVEKLGQGGFGITYLAEQTTLGREVAIKEFFMKNYCLRDEDTSKVSVPTTGNSKDVEQYRKKFVKEAGNLSRMNHPHIISVQDLFEENNTVYYVMPALTGGSLRDRVKAAGQLTEAEAMTYVRQVASALKYMHEELHICHYDVKPANILLDDKGNAVLIDFGIAKNYDSEGHETSITPVGMSEGYAPIEQYQQQVGEFTPASDIYALGATLYYMLHGKRPASAVQRVNDDTLVFRDGLSDGVKALMTRALAVSKRKRPASVDVFLGDLSQLVQEADDDDDEETVLKPRHRSDESTVVAGVKAVENAEDNTDASADGGGKESSYMRYLLMAVGIGLLAVLLFFLGRNSNQEPEDEYEPIPAAYDVDESMDVDSVEEEVDSLAYDDFDMADSVAVAVPSQSAHDWSGRYIAEYYAGDTYGGTGIAFEISFNLSRVSDDEYTGTMSIDGYQTGTGPAKIEGHVVDNRIKIYYVSSSSDGMPAWSDICSPNTSLLSMDWSGGHISANWFSALVEQGYVSQTTSVERK